MDSISLADFSLADKDALLADLREHLRRDLEAAIGAQKETQAGATHEESRPENDKDTRALESTYLARGLAQRVADLVEALAKVASLRVTRFAADDEVGVGALVVLREDTSAHQNNDSRVVWLAPCGGGLRLSLRGVAVQVVTVDSPWGQALVGRCQGEEVEAPKGANGRAMTITAVL